MSGDKCSYFNCDKSKRKNKDVQFHVFPADVNRSKMWLLNCGNIKLNILTPERLRRRYICSNHFNDCMYMNLNVEKRRLIQNAIPIKYTEQSTDHLNEAHFSQTHTIPVKCEPFFNSQEEPILNFSTEDEFDTKQNLFSTSTEELKVLTPKKKYFPASIDIRDHKNAALSMFSRTPDTQECTTDLSTWPTSSEKHNNKSLNNLASLKLQLKNEHLESRCIKLQKLLSKKRATISFLKKKYLRLLHSKKAINSKQFLQLFKFQSISSKSLVSMQINHKLRKPWTTEEKEFSISLYNKSPSTYRYMCQNKIILPGLSTIRHWLAESKAESTLTQSVK